MRIGTEGTEPKERTSEEPEETKCDENHGYLPDYMSASLEASPEYLELLAKAYG